MASSTAPAKQKLALDIICADCPEWLVSISVKTVPAGTMTPLFNIPLIRPKTGESIGISFIFPISSFSWIRSSIDLLDWNTPSRGAFTLSEIFFFWIGIFFFFFYFWHIYIFGFYFFGYIHIYIHMLGLSFLFWIFGFFFFGKSSVMLGMIDFVGGSLDNWIPYAFLSWKTLQACLGT